MYSKLHTLVQFQVYILQCASCISLANHAFILGHLSSLRLVQLAHCSNLELSYIVCVTIHVCLLYVCYVIVVMSPCHLIVYGMKQCFLVSYIMII